MNTNNGHPDRLLAATLGFLLATQGLLPHPAQASGLSIARPEFFELPDDPQAFLAGERFDADGRSLAQTTSYLYMAGAFGAGQQALFDAYLQERASRAYTPGYGGWQQALSRLGRSVEYYSTAKAIVTETTVNGRRYTSNSYFENCLDDAFDTATATLQERRNRYGANSPMFTRWVDAQIQVFTHCNGETFNPPAAPDPAWELLEQQDRAYQIAAAYFYAMQYEEAARRFDAIGMDAASPWSELGKYLVGRSLIRQALVANTDRERNLAAADSVFAALGQDEDYLRRFPSVRGQRSYISIKQDAATFLNRMGTLLVEDPAQLTAGELADFLFLWNYAAPEVATDGAFAHWMRLANDGSPTATQNIIEAWRTYRTRPWLYLALSRANRNTDAPAIEQLAAETATLEARDRVSAELLATTARMLQQSGRVLEAATLAQRVLADSQAVLTATQRNVLQYALAQSSSDWRDFAARAQLDVVAMTYDSYQFATVTAQELAVATHGSRLFPTETTTLINTYYTPAMLLELIADGRLSGYLVGRTAIAAWVKALMLGDTVSAQAAARILSDYYPERREALEPYLEGTNAEFEAAALILELPGYSPYLSTGFGRKEFGSGDFVPDHVADGLTQQNWWCTMIYDYQNPLAQENYRQQAAAQAAVDLAQPMFSAFNAEQKSELAAMHPQLQRSVAAAFGPAIVDYARANPDDPRVPRLLFRVVFATRYACNGGPGDVSRAAFELLHANYPDSEWAEQTPYWFD